MSEKQITYHAAAQFDQIEPAPFDEITALVVPTRADRFTPHVGRDVLVSVHDLTDPRSGLIPVAAQVTGVAAAAGMGDGYGTMVTFTHPIIVPRSPRLMYTICDEYGSLIQ